MIEANFPIYFMDFHGRSWENSFPSTSPKHDHHIPAYIAPPGLRDANDLAEGIDGGTVIVTMASQHRLHELHFVLSKLGMSRWWWWFTNKDLTGHGDFGWFKLV